MISKSVTWYFLLLRLIPVLSDIIWGFSLKPNALIYFRFSHNLCFLYWFQDFMHSTYFPSNENATITSSPNKASVTSHTTLSSWIFDPPPFFNLSISSLSYSSLPGNIVHSSQPPSNPSLHSVPTIRLST